MKFHNRYAFTLIFLFVVTFLSGCGSGGSNNQSNQKPFAKVIANQTAKVGDIVTLDGSSSSPSGKLSYKWSFVSIPADASATLDKPNNATTEFTPDVVGDYKVQLIVNDGTQDSQPAITTVSIETGNAPPVAKAGDNAVVNMGTKVTLDGSASNDPEGAELTYKWSFAKLPDGSNAIFRDAKTVKPSFFAGVNGDYVIQLIVNDGSQDSQPVTVTVTAAIPVRKNTAPIAYAGPDSELDQTTQGLPVTLNGTGSDAEGDPLTYSWKFTTIPAGSTAVLTAANTANPTFTADKLGTYSAQLIVNDGKLDSDPDTVNIIVRDPNSTDTTPIAVAGLPVTVDTGTTVTLDGSKSSDSDGDVLTYKWAISSKPNGSNVTLTNLNTVNPSLTPDVAGKYVIQLIVNDGKVDSNPDSVTITANKPNTPPVANAGKNTTATINTKVTLYGIDSTDADGDLLTFKWSFVSRPSGSNATLNAATTANPDFTPDVLGDYVVQLVVNDGKVDSSPATVTVTAIKPNTPPVANAGADMSVGVLKVANLNGSGSDADSDPLTYKWSIASSPANSHAVILNGTSKNAQLIANMAGNYTVQLVTNDGKIDSTADSAIVNITAPAATACSNLKSPFSTTTWPVLDAKCVSCHQDGGVTSALNLIPGTPLNIDANFAAFKTVSALKDNGLSIMLAKPLRVIPHLGGTAFDLSLSNDQNDYNTLADMVAQLDTCIDSTPSQTDIDYGTPYQRLRKATLTLAGRLPTAAEEALVNGAANDTAFKAAFNSTLDNVMKNDPGFYQRIKEIYNDLILTDAFPGTRVFNFDFSNFNNAKYFDDSVLQSNGYSVSGDRNTIRSNLGIGVAQAPLELVAHVVHENRPFTEILTANYVMVNPYSATLYDANVNIGPNDPPFTKFNYGDAANQRNPYDFREAVITSYAGMKTAYPHAGILSTLAFLNRYPTTATNLNRARARYVFKYFLDIDVEGLADRAGLNLDNVIGTFPTLEDPQCTQCHDVVDPVAGLFKYWRDRGKFQYPFTWPSDKSPPEMLSPGYTKNDLFPGGTNPSPLQWLAARVATDNRFALSTVKKVFKGFTGQEPTPDMTIFLENVKTDFINSNYNLKVAIKDIINSDYFLALNLSSTATPTLYPNIGMGRLLTPEQLNRKIQAVTAGYNGANSSYTWKGSIGGDLLNPDYFLLLYGGIDSDQVISRTTDPTAFTSGIQDNLAFKSSCDVVPVDFTQTKTNRALFPDVEITTIPDNGGAGTTAIKQNIQYLHKRLLGEELGTNDAEVTATYTLFQNVLNATNTSNTITYECRGSLSSTDPIYLDKQGTVRAWMAVFAYMLLDYKFLYE